jgi:ankyrin repeat protein
LDPNSLNSNRETALIHAVKQNNIDYVESLLEKGASPNIQDSKGRTALHYAINNSSSTIDASFDMESLLISFNADLNI